MLLGWPVWLCAAFASAAGLWPPASLGPLGRMAVLIGASGLLFWSVLRRCYLSRWRILFAEQGFRLREPRRKGAGLCWHEVVAADGVYPSINALLQLIAEPPWKEKLAGDHYNRSAVPLGFELKHAWRRLWTLSSDLVIQTRRGQFAVVPMAALSGRERRMLRTQLALAGICQYDSARVRATKTGHEAEMRGNQALLARRWPEAASAYVEAAQRFETAGRMDCVARCLRLQADALMRVGQYSDVRDVAERAVGLARHLRDPAGQAYALNQLSEVDWHLGGIAEVKVAARRIRNAGRLYDHAGDVVAAIKMNANEGLHSLALFRLARDRAALARAEQITRHALKRLRHELKHDSRVSSRLQEANLLGTLGQVLLEQEKWQESERYFRRAHEIGDQCGKRGFVEDLGAWGRALAAMAEAPGDDVRPTDQLLHEAFEKLAEAIRLAATQGDVETILQMHVARGDVFHRLGNHQAATRDYQAAAGVVESMRAGLLRLFEKSSLLRRHGGIYGRLAESLLRQAARQTDPELVERAFACAEAAKARNLVELMARAQIRANDPDEELLRAYQDAQAVEREKMLGLQRALQTGVTNTDELWRAARQAQQAATRAEDTLFRARPDLRDRLSPVLPTIREVLEWFPDDHTAVVEFLPGPKALCVFILSRGADPTGSGLLIEGLGEANLGKWLREAWLDAYGEFQAVRSRPHSVDEQERAMRRWVDQLPHLVEDIWQRIFEPSAAQGRNLAAVLNERRIRRLVLVPHGLMHLVPLHAACRIRDGRRTHLADEMEISYVASCHVLSKVLRVSPPPRIGRALIVCDPSGTLKGAPLECRAVRGALDAQSVEPLELDEPATVAAVLRRVPESDWNHFAVHAAFRTADPWDKSTGLALADAPLDLLTMFSHLHLRNGCTCVLSACETSLIALDEAAECTGFASALLLAGCRTVISTLWGVDDEWTAMLMGMFYTNLFAGNGITSPVPALTAAQRSVRGASRASLEAWKQSVPRAASARGITPMALDPGLPPDHPYFWAAFCICGATWEPSASVHVEARVAAVRAAQHLSAGMGPDLTQALERAQSLERDGQREAAIETLRRRSESCPHSLALRERLGHLYADKGDNEAAEHEFRECIRIDENYHRGYYNLGCLLRDVGRITEARQCLLESLTLDPGYANAMANLAELTNDCGEAMRLLTLAGAIQPGDNDIGQAAKMWSDLSRLKPAELIRHRLFWAAQASEAKNHSYARVHLALAREGEHLLDDQGRAGLLATESDVLRAENDITGSLRSLEKAVNLDPTVALYWNNLAARRLLRAESLAHEQAIRELERAKGDAERAISMNDQEYTRPHQNLASIHMRLGDLTADPAHRQLAKDSAQRALHIATRQHRVGPDGPLVCDGCSTQGKLPAACQECAEKARNLLRDLELGTGEYRVD